MIPLLSCAYISIGIVYSYTKYMNCRRKELSMRMCPYCGHEGLNSGSYCSYCGRIHNVSTSLDKYNLGLIENCKRCLIYKYADFEGRASRGEYWYFLLMYQLLFVATLFICAFLSYISPLSSIVGVGGRIGAVSAYIRSRSNSPALPLLSVVFMIKDVRAFLCLLILYR